MAKAKLNNEFDGSNLDVTRLSIFSALVQWAENEAGSETLEKIGVTYHCNGDSMFHVDKGVIGFRIDGAENIKLINTSVKGLHNEGIEGSSICGDYIDGMSNPKSILTGYGGSKVRGYSFAGSKGVKVVNSYVENLSSLAGSVMGFDVLTDTSDVKIINSRVRGLHAGTGGSVNEGVTEGPLAIGYRVSEDATDVKIFRGCATWLFGESGKHFLLDDSEEATTVNTCRANRH